MKVKLNNIYNRQINVSLYRKSTGIKRTSSFPFVPNEIYDVDKLSEDFLYVENTLMNKIDEQRYSKELEQQLKDTNSPHEIYYCASCGGRVKKIKIPIFIKVEEEKS